MESAGLSPGDTGAGSSLSEFGASYQIGHMPVVQTRYRRAAQVAHCCILTHFPRLFRVFTPLVFLCPLGFPTNISKFSQTIILFAVLHTTAK